jgi:hypothetical protein
LVITGSAGGKLKAKLVEEQEIVMNLADILAMSFLAESAFLRVAKLKGSNGVDKKDLSIKIQMAQLFLYDALETARLAAKNAIDSYADGFTKWYMQKLVNGLLKSYAINPKDTRRSVANFYLEKGKF